MSRHVSIRRLSKHLPEGLWHRALALPSSEQRATKLIKPDARLRTDGCRVALDSDKKTDLCVRAHLRAFLCPVWRAWAPGFECSDRQINFNSWCVAQVFDCGCIGEGALHIVAAARKHLKPGAHILPAAAQVSCSCSTRKLDCAASSSPVSQHPLPHATGLLPAHPVWRPHRAAHQAAV